MHYLVKVDCNGMAGHLTRNDLWGVLRSAGYSIQWMGLMLICCGKAVKRLWKLGVCWLV